MKVISPLDIDGIEIGQATNTEAGTGCTVVLCRSGATAGVAVRGGGPATRETDLLRPENMVQRIHAIMLSGGSAFGLDAASGAMQWLDEHGIGFDTGVAHVPIVCGASLFDLGCGRFDIRPDKAMGYEACEDAMVDGPLEEGSVGAGTGASVGKTCGMSRAMKSGIGAYGLESDGLQVATVVAVNALGTVVETDGTPLAGVLAKDASRILSVEEGESAFLEMGKASFPSNTTLSCVITNASLDKAQATKVASIAHDGYARAIRPVHSSNDGDAVFVLATGAIPVPMDIVGLLAADTCEEAIRRAARTAKSAYGLKSAGDMDAYNQVS